MHARLALVLVTTLSACIDFYPDINEACDSAADRCSDYLAYDECVDDAIGLLDEDPEESSTVRDCLEESPCDGIETCFDPEE